MVRMRLKIGNTLFRILGESGLILMRKAVKMKFVLMIAVSVLLSACSSMNYIETDKYESLVKERCLSKVETPTKQQKAKCSMKSSSSVNFAYRMYEVRAKQDYSDCLKESDVKVDQNACFKNKQSTYYNNYFKIK